MFTRCGAAVTCSLSRDDICSARRQDRRLERGFRRLGDEHLLRRAGNRIYGALPEFIYSLAEDGLYVDLFAASSIEWKQAGQPLELRMITDFPFRRGVERVRVPAWAAKDMPVQVNGAGVALGKAGSYVVLDRTWKDGDVISFVLPAEFRLTHYMGQERVPSRELYALEYGPILMVPVGDVDEKGNARVPHGPGDLIRNLSPKVGHPLTFQVDGDPAHEYIPYWQVGTRVFTCHPALAQGSSDLPWWIFCLPQTAVPSPLTKT